MGALLCLLAAPVSAGDVIGAPADRGWSDAVLVRQLLDLDKQAVLQAERGRLSASGAASNGKQALPPALSGPRRRVVASTAERIEIHAIYGVGSDLTAELRIDGESINYRAGSPWPAGRPRVASTYALLGVHEGCVRLERRSLTRRVCLATAKDGAP